jgi:alkaline phosphatase D
MRIFRLLSFSLVGVLSILSVFCAQGDDTIGAYRPSTWLHGVLLQSGPMIGHVGESSAAIWLRAKHGTTITAHAVQEGARFPAARIQDLESGFRIVHFAGLRPASRTEVVLELTREGFVPEKEQLSFRTSPVPARVGKVRLAFGSCAKISQFRVAPVFEAIADERPDFSIFLGDYVYFIVADGSDVHFRGTPTNGPVGDWNFYESMVARYLRTRNHPDLRRMQHTVPSYAVWDDHDFGPNNADSLFELKEESARAFIQVWANPSYGTAATPGIFSSFRHGPVEVFLMDDRYHKLSPQWNPVLTPETGRIWGEGQLRWLMDGLRASTAPVKLIANGTQFLSLSKAGEGHYQEARGERTALLEFLARERIGGVVFLTGDRHFSEAAEQAQPDGTLVVECMSSPLQQGQRVGPIDRPHPNQLWSMRGNSYGLVTIELPQEGKGSIRFEARDEHNQTPVVGGVTCATTWTIDRLSYETKKALKPRP